MNKVEITQGNFYLGTKCRFKGCKRPKRKADFISYNKYGEISSEYWYGSDTKGNYVIRSSEHWSNSNNKHVFSCNRIVSCYWWLITNSNSFLFKNYCGKAYFSSFGKNRKK